MGLAVCSRCCRMVGCFRLGCSYTSMSILQDQAVVEGDARANVNRVDALAGDTRGVSGLRQMMGGSLSPPHRVRLAPRAAVRRWWSVFRAAAADLLWLQFGERHIVSSSRAGAREVGEYALHVQCAWTIACGQGTVSASDFMPAARIDGGLSVFVRKHCPALVEGVAGDDRGGFTISLAGGCTMKVLPHDDSEEQWRLLQPGKGAPHVGLLGAELTEL
jgi:hypothetical protein